MKILRQGVHREISTEKEGRSPQHARSTGRRKRVILWVVSTVTVVLFAFAGSAAWAYFQVMGNIKENVVARPGKTEEPVKIPTWDGAVNLLVMGTDSRLGQITGDYGDTGESARADVMMVLHISADHKNATLVSVPRDTMAATPQCTNTEGQVVPAKSVTQLNGVLDDGPYCMMAAVSQLTGLQLDHFIVVDFDGVVNITQAIGGVDVCVTEPVNDPYSGLNISAGEHNLAGAEALAFLRTRHGFGDGSDLTRISAQQVFLSALARKIKSSDVLTNPVALYGLVNSVSQSFSVDEALGNSQSLVGLASTLATTDLGSMVMIQLPVEEYPADQNRVQPVKTLVTQLFDALKSDVPVVLADGAPTQDAAVPGEAPSPPTSAETPSPTESATPTPSTELPSSVKGQVASKVTCAR
ncbi:LCP family protein [Lysinibacter sp. HNR]|uniref:LCP family protein n=1 Tax=Lysinibacter sp. HNR TaxID=3031408 RepID=UPI002435481D|nr:LCP family protein [Lysinibacter sp. HNR]WGD38330.1 LCP family protein [Lysinibacter sp. HNR]